MKISILMLTYRWSKSYVSWLILFVIVLVVSILQTAKPVQANRLTPPPTAEPIYSLFADDTCSPPCWFGLTPGESTLDDVIAMFRAHRDLFLVNPEQGPELYLIAENFDSLLEGERSTFLWKTWDIDWALTESRIDIIGGLVISIDVVMNQTVSLRDTLEMLGQPSEVLAVADLGLSLSLFYADQNVIVSLWTAQLGQCDRITMLDDLSVSGLFYYAPNTLEAVQETFTGYLLIAPEVWAEWQTAENITCAEAFRQQRQFENSITPRYPRLSNSDR